MKVLYNDPELQLLEWRLDERTLLARVGIARRLGPGPSVVARLRAAPIRSVGGFLIRFGRWLTEQPGVARPLDVSGQINPNM